MSRVLVTGKFAALSIWAVLVVSARASDWPQWRGPNQNSISAETHWTTDWPDGKPKILWKADLGEGCASFAVEGGLVYTMGASKQRASNLHVLWCLNAETGEVVWQAAFPQDQFVESYEVGPCITPCVSGGYVYTLGKMGHARCFDARNGKPIWDTPSHPAFERIYKDDVGMCGLTSSPFVLGELLITGTRALNKDDGKLVWQMKLEDNCRWASPTVYTRNGRQSILCLNRRGLSAIDPQDGSRLWRFKFESGGCTYGSEPVVYGEDIFFSSTAVRRGKDPASVMIHIDDSGPQIVWQNTKFVASFQQRIVWQNHVYGCDTHRTGHSDECFKCVDLKTGEIVWSEKKFEGGQMIAAAGKLIILDKTGVLSIIEATPQGFRPVASAQVVEEAEVPVLPVLSNGRIYCRGVKGDLVCLDVRVPH